MNGYILISRHHGALNIILGHTPYLSGSSGVVGLCRQILVEMLSHILIFWGFITSLLDVIHSILGHTPYMSRSSGVCWIVHTVLVKMLSHVLIGPSHLY